MTEFCPGRTADQAHHALKSALHTMEKAKQSAVLWFGDILERKLYADLGCSSINQYAKVELGFSNSRTGDFLNLCHKLKTLPRVKAEVASGRLDYTKARVLVGVADPTNEVAWLDLAQGRSRRELEREVKRAKLEAAEKNSGQVSLLPVVGKRPAAVVPVRVSMGMSPTQFARYEKLWEQIRKTGGVPADMVEALLTVMAVFPGQSATRVDVSPAVQIHVHQCPDCERAVVQTSKGELELGAAELEHAQCDCQISDEGGRNRTAIPPATRRKVLARDRHRCQRPGCEHTRFLEVHHKLTRARGGTNDEDNLTTLCSGCHRFVHRRGKVSEPADSYACSGQRSPDFNMAYVIDGKTEIGDTDRLRAYRIFPDEG